ncbi:MAG: hypothetical protein H7199_11595 [Burkholderiales bacterium]|nr:hypothetical protein [Flavobacterium sp.]
MSQEKEIKKNWIFDFASILAVGGIVLYSLGWTYWSKYYKDLKIDFTFIDLQTDKIIATTWLFVISMLSFFVLAFTHILENKHKSTIDAIGTAFVIASGIIIFLGSSSIINIRWFVGSVIFSFFLLFIIRWFCNKLNLQTEMSLNLFNYILFFVIYFCSIFYFNNLAKKDANTFIKSYKDNIELTLNKDNQIVN